MENHDLIAAAELIAARSTLDAHVSAPGREVDIELEGHLLIRLTPAGNSVEIHVFRRENLLASEVRRRPRSAERLAERVERIFQRAIAER